MEAPMDAHERRAIEEECRGLVVSLIHHGDHGENEAAVDLFTSDGTWVRGGKPYTGRDVIPEFNLRVTIWAQDKGLAGLVWEARMDDQNRQETDLVENRRFPRTSVIWSGTLESQDGVMDCIAMNLSANGAKLQLPMTLDQQMRTWILTIPRLGKFRAELAWSANDDGQKIGLRFQNPPGVVAQQLAKVLSKSKESFIAA